MKYEIYNCVIVAGKTVKTNLDDNHRAACYIVTATDQSAAEDIAIEAYNSAPDKFKHSYISVFALLLDTENLISLMNGKALQLALAKMEVVDELDAEILE